MRTSTLLSRAPRALASLCIVVLVGAQAGCRTKELRDEIGRLRAENTRLKFELDQLSKNDVKPSRIDEFTVGLAASERSFDEQAFETLLRDSLKAASAGDETPAFSLSRETDDGKITKVRGMLLQQYLAEKRVPIRIFNLSYKLRSEEDRFTIGGTPVPTGAATRTKTADGNLRCTYAGPLIAHMERTGKNTYSVSFDNTGGGGGTLPLTVEEADIIDPGGTPRIVRHGDIAFNWQLSIEKLLVYRVADFEGDVGRFLRSMRYPSARTNLNQYQTIRDSVFLFGYGPYTTGLVNRIETPPYISSVEVLPISAAVYDELKGGIPLDDLKPVLGKVDGKWVECSFVELDRDAKVWERPVSVDFPFVSRQTSKDRNLVFYTKYNRDGSTLIGDYRLGRQ